MQQYFVNLENDKFRLKDEDLYHLAVVLRAEKKQIACVYDGESFLCEFNGNKDSYEIKVIEKIDHDSELDIDIEIYQALIRNENFDLVLQKATELGAKAIAPTIFERNVVKIEDNKKENKIKRFETICKNASEQSRRIIVPEILPIQNVKNITLKDGEIGLVCYEKNSDIKSLSNIKDEVLKANKIKVVIGPEGGISEKEYNALIDNGFYSISLGKRILRSETAAFNILSVLGFMIENK